MKKIILHGILKKYFCESFFLKTDNLKDIFNALFCNYPDYKRKMNQIRKFCQGFALVLDGRIFHKDIDEIDYDIRSSQQIEIIPCSVPKIFSALTAVLVSIGVGALTAKILAFVVIIAISIGISFLVSSLMKPGDPKQLKTSSYIFSSRFNASTRNTPIPISYGRLKMNSNIINAFLLSYDIDYIRNLPIASAPLSQGSLTAAI